MRTYENNSHTLNSADASVFLWAANNPILALVIPGNLAPVYINMFEIKKKKKKNLGKK